MPKGIPSTQGIRDRAGNVRPLLLIPLILAVVLFTVPQPARAATSVTLSSNAQTETTATLTWSESSDWLFSSYTLYYSTTGTYGPWTNLWSTTDISQTSMYVYGLSSNSNYWFHILDTDSLGTANSNTIQVTTKSDPFLQVYSVTTTTCSLLWYDYNTYSSSVPFDSYTVQLGSSSTGPWSTLAAIFDSAQTNYVATGLSPGQTYYLVMYDTVGSSGYQQRSYSNAVTCSAPSVTISALKTTTDVGQSVVIVSSTVGGTTPFGYQWYSNGNTVPYATASSYTFSPASAGTYGFYVTVLDSKGALATSNSVSIVVNPSPTITISASATEISLNEHAQLTSTISGGTAPFSYQWYLNWNPVPGAASSAFTFFPTSTGTYGIYVVVRDSSGSSVTSNSISITVRARTILTLSAPTVASMGGSISISAKLTDGSGNPLAGQTISFSVAGVSVGSAMTDSSGTASVTYSVPGAAGSYTVLASYAGTQTYSPNSATGTLVVKQFYLTVITTVPNAQLVRVNGATYATDASGTARIPISTLGTYDVSIVSPYATGTGTRAVFLKWSDDSTSNLRVVVMDSDQTLSAVTKIQYMLTVQGPTGSATGGAGWYDANAESIATIGYVWGTTDTSRYSLSSYELDGGSGVNVARREVGDYSCPIRMDSPHTIVFTGVKQFLVKVTSAYGTVAGAGWHDVGSTAVFSVSPSRVSAGFLSFYVFTGWSGDSSAKTSSASILVDSPATLTANWTVDSSLLYVVAVCVVVAAAAVGIVFWTITETRNYRGRAAKKVART